MPHPLHHASPLPPGFIVPTAAAGHDLPLQGVTILAVEDSRFACEALRLMCQKAGARLRRAESLAAARGHLRVYKPDVVIVDLGLPDGRGEALIRDLILSPRRPLVILGTSGNPDGRASALASGADGFLDKPLESFQGFCRTLRGYLPSLAPDQAAPTTAEDAIQPDLLALQDDLSRAAMALSANPNVAEQQYVARFLSGIAHHAHDAALARAAYAVDTQGNPAGLQELRDIVDSRLNLDGEKRGPFHATPLEG